MSTYSYTMAESPEAPSQVRAEPTGIQQLGSDPQLLPSAAQLGSTGSREPASWLGPHLSRMLAKVPVQRLGLYGG